MFSEVVLFDNTRDGDSGTGYGICAGGRRRKRLTNDPPMAYDKVYLPYKDEGDLKEESQQDQPPKQKDTVKEFQKNLKASEKEFEVEKDSGEYSFSLAVVRAIAQSFASLDTHRFVSPSLACLFIFQSPPAVPLACAWPVAVAVYKPCTRSAASCRPPTLKSRPLSPTPNNTWLPLRSCTASSTRKSLCCNASRNLVPIARSGGLEARLVPPVSSSVPLAVS